MIPSFRPARYRMVFGSVPFRKYRTDPSPNPKFAPRGWRLLNACGAVPLIWAVASSTYQKQSLIRTLPMYHPVYPAQMAASFPLGGSYMHSPITRVFDDPSVMSPTRTRLFM